MDAIIQKQLQVDGIESLKVQNHIYGCFVLMEDIAENISLEGYTLKGTFSFDLDKQFSQIGIRYGFILDTKLIFDSFLPEYKAAWLALFTEINAKKQLEEVDKVEDSFISIIKSTVPAELAFFTHALASGSLPQEWIDRVITLLTGSIPLISIDKDEEYKNALMNAHTEKQMKRCKKTRRNIVIIKKALGKTRRAIRSV